jgi:small-conductance mechanosensitive channel
MMHWMSHMRVCPHCNQAGITNFAVRWSSAGGPAICKACQKLSHVIASTSSGIPVATLLLACAGFLVTATATNSFLFSLLVACTMALPYNIWAWRRAKLFPILPENALNARKAGWVLMVVYVLSFFIS